MCVYFYVRTKLTQQITSLVLSWAERALLQQVQAEEEAASALAAVDHGLDSLGESDMLGPPPV